jgi:peptidyl-prolyl cis-trans isomerase D
MLGAMRKGSQNFFVKALLFVLAASFVVWGIGDVFRGSSDSTVAKIGDEEISYSEYYASLQREISRFQQILGGTLTEEQLQQFGIKDRVLAQLIDSKIIRMRLDELKLKVGDEIVRKQLKNNSLFFDESGKFNVNTFKTVLRSNGLNEKQYIMALKEDAAVKMLIDTLSAAPSSLDIKAKALYKYRNEYRTADMVYIPADYVKDVEDPSETELLQYYQDNTDKFSVPESRKVTYIVYGFEDVKNAVEISKEALKADYQDNKDSFLVPEKRDVVQYIFESETDAQKALEDINEGKVSMFNDKKLELGEMTKEGLPDKIKEPVFELEVGQYSEPVKTDFGWHILTINKVVPESVREFEEVKDELESYLKEVKAAEIFDKEAIKIEDEIASGVPLEEIAKKFDLVIHSVPAINANGQGATGKSLTDIPEPEIFSDVAFSTDYGQVSPMTLLSDNSTYVLVRVDNVTPKRVKALDEVKGTVATLWKEVQKRKKLREIAENVAVKIKQGENLKQLSSSMGLKFKTSDKIKRPSADFADDAKNDIPRQLTTELFDLERGDSTSYYLTSKGGYMIARLNEIKDGKFDKNRVASLEDGLKKDFTDDVLNQYNMYLRKQYPIEKNETLLNSSNL